MDLAPAPPSIDPLPPSSTFASSDSSSSTFSPPSPSFSPSPSSTPTSSPLTAASFSQISSTPNFAPAPLRTSSVEKKIHHKVGQILSFSRTSEVCVLPYNRCIANYENNYYLAWGFVDCSIRLFSGENDQLVGIAEATHDGQITCVVTLPSTRTVITGGNDGVVCLSSLSPNPSRALTIGKSLRGHAGPITCLIVCSSYNVIISGSSDGGVIVWDLNQNNFGFLRRLREGGGDDSIVGVSINHLEGDIAACSYQEIWTWSINGHPYVRKNLKKEEGSFSEISALLMSNQEAWTGHNFCITGHEDGSIKVWKTTWTNNNNNNTPVRDLVPILNLNIHVSPVSCFHLNSTETMFYSGDNSGVVMVTSWKEAQEGSGGGRLLEE